MATFENDGVDLRSLFYSQSALGAGPTAGFHRAAYGGVLDHRFNPQPDDTLGFKADLQALAGLEQPLTPQRHPDTLKNG